MGDCWGEQEGGPQDSAHKRATQILALIQGPKAQIPWPFLHGNIPCADSGSLT